ncbi:MAG: putative quinol monooxygenase [bacterium]
MSTKTVRVIALFKAKPGKEESLKAFLTRFIEPTRRERGCLRYELHQNTADPADFAFIEEWEDHGTLDDHLKSPHIQAALPVIGDYVAISPDIRRYSKCD